MRKFIWSAMICACGISLGGCTQSMERAQHDVRTAQERAMDNVRQEQADLQETKRDAADRIARQERRVEDAAQRGNEQITREQRDLEDARKAEARRAEPDRNAAPPESSHSTIVVPAKRPARVDVDVNRGPGGGVKVDVNRNP